MPVIRYNKGQKYVIDECIDNLHHGSKQIFEYCGKAGTGKSEVMIEIARRSGIPLYRIAPMAYIGQAAIVMRSKGFSNAKTAHSWTKEFREVEVIENGVNVLDPILGTPLTRWEFIDKDLSSEIDLMIIDEGATMPLSMRQSLLDKGKPIVVTGDIRQLPPVADKPAFLQGEDCIELDEVIRQKQGSGILYIADLLYNNITPHPGRYGDDCVVIYEDELNDATLRDATMIVTGTNRNRDKYNNHIRHNILGYNSDLPMPGEKLICRDNDWTNTVNGIALANGLRGTITEPIDIETFNGETFSINFRPDFFDAEFYDIELNYNYLNGDKAMRDAIKHSPYCHGYNFEYAYALTAHLSQGAQSKNVIAFQDYLSPEINRNVWYTAATRATDFLVFVIHRPKRYFYN